MNCHAHTAALQHKDGTGQKRAQTHARKQELPALEVCATVMYSANGSELHPSGVTGPVTVQSQCAGRA
jgi:hypothetical protein